MALGLWLYFSGSAVHGFASPKVSESYMYTELHKKALSFILSTLEGKACIPTETCR
jgi:hypothetical protein